MSEDVTSTRRMFLRGGALLAAPIAAAATCAVAQADDTLQARVTRLEAQAAIRELHQSWLREVNAGERHELLDGAVRRISADHAGAADRIEVAADGCNAVGYYPCAIELDRPLDSDCTLAQMARAQGHGTVRRTERRRLTVDYTKTGANWRIGKVVVTPLS
jgi:hypothetical protein